MNTIRTIIDFILRRHSVRTEPMPRFELERYMGVWYEVARLENRFEKGLSRVTARYSLGEDGVVSVTNCGYDAGRGMWKTARARAVAGDAPNHLKVYFMPFFYGRYEIAFLDADYSRAVVSGGSLNYLWFMARSPRLDRDWLCSMLRRAEELGYDTSLLVYAEPWS